MNSIKGVNVMRSEKGRKMFSKDKLVVKLRKGNEFVEYDTGNALYLLLYLIPGLSIFGLCLAIIKRQFRGVSLNLMIIGLVYLGCIVLLFGLRILTGFGIFRIIYAMLYLALAIIIIAIKIMYIVNANYYAIKARLNEGYVVTNIEYPEVQQACEKARGVTIPFWQITKF